jgi:large subunit ribosomal protein L9
MARTIEVLLKDNIFKLGSMGDIVTVKPGYARNYLLPQCLAVLANTAAKRQIEKLRERAAEVEAADRASAESLQKQLSGLSIEISARVAHDDVLFGSVGTRDIAAAVNANGFDVSANQVHLHESLKSLGTYNVVIGLHKGVEASISVSVINANPDADLDTTLADADEAAAE